VNGADRLSCIGRKRGTCGNAVTVRRSSLERRVLSGIKERLLSAKAVETAVEAARQELLRRQREQARDEGRLRREQGEAQQAIANILRAIEDGMYQPSLKERLSEAEARRARAEAGLAQLLAAAEAVPQIPHPRIAEAYRRRVEEMEAVLGGDDVVAAEAREVVRSLITRIAVRPDAAVPDRVQLELEGDLAVLLRMSEAEQAKPPRALALGGSQTTVDAGTRKRLDLLVVA
jgi:hypothetical protein